MKKALLVVLCGVFLAACNTTVNTSMTSSPSPVAEDTEETMMMTSPSPEMSPGSDSMMMNETSMTAVTKTITLGTQSNLGQSGTAVLTEENGKVKVTLTMTGGSFTSPQPAHIHEGSCPKPGAVKYPLTNVVNGKSETILNVDMATVMKSATKLAINVHKSAAEPNVYTACGNLQ